MDDCQMKDTKERRKKKEKRRRKKKEEEDKQPMMPSPESRFLIHGMDSRLNGVC